MQKKIEQGKQLGIEKRIQRQQKHFGTHMLYRKKEIYIMFMNMKLQKIIWQKKFVNMKIYTSIYLLKMLKILFQQNTELVLRISMC